MAQVELGRLRGLTLILTLSTGGVSPSGLPLLIFTGGQRSASFDRGSAVDGVFLCSAPSGHSESDGGLGLWAQFLTDPLSLAFAQ